jgi:uncharacterized protein YhaN
MRLTALSLIRYGNFASERIAFDPRPGVLNLLLAPNGGGKSVLRSAFCDLLFGIGGQTPMGFRYGYPGMRIAAEAIGPTGETFEFGRRKGQGNTLVDGNGATLDQVTIARLLGRTDRVRLERLFALDTERLRQGEADLLASDGELGPALVSGAGGAHDLRALRKGLVETRDSLAPTRRAAQRPFYLALDRFVDARKRVQSSLLRPEQWQKQEQERDAAATEQSEQNRLAESAHIEIARLERIRRVMPWLAARDAAAAWLDAHPDAPALDPALAVQLNEARSAIVIAEQRMVREADAAARLAEQLGQVVIDTTLLAEDAEIDGLVEAAGAARKAASDLPSVTAQAIVRTTVVASRLQELSSALPVERAADAIPPRAGINRARRLIQAYAARSEAAKAAPGQEAELALERSGVLEQLTALPASGDVSELAALVKEVRADGDPARRARDAVATRQEAYDALTAALARVPGWIQGDAALLALAPLLPDTYKRHEDELIHARTEAAARMEALRAARQVRDEARDRLTAIATSGPLPDEAGLTRARTRRDDGWQLIYRRAFTSDPPAQHEEQEFAGPLPLPLAYERAVAAADGIADRRVHEAAVIERAEAAQAALRDAAERVNEAETRYRLADEMAQATQRVWAQICEVLPLGEAPTFRDVQAFLTARDRVIETRQKHLAATAAENALSACHAGWAARLASMLEAEGEPSLTLLLAAADRRLAETQRAERSRAALEAKRDSAEKALVDAQARRRQADAALTEWREEWARAMRELGRAPDEDPSVADDVLQVFAELDQAQKDVAVLGERVAGMRRDIELFQRSVVALAARVAPELDGTDPLLLIAELRRRAQHAREQAKQRDLLRQQSRAASATVALAQRELAERQAALRAILLLAGAETVEDAERRLALAAERARHAAGLAEADAKLREAGDLLPLAQLREEVAAIPPEEIPGRIDAADHRRKAAQAAAQEAAATASSLAQQMRQAQEDTRTADAAADQQAAVATIGRVLEEALVHHVAAEMLDQALAAVEQQGESALLRRIGTLFSQLTRGVYSRVLTEIGEDNVTRLILLQRDHPEERQSVRELSEGTRDQLYLALRLAAIEQHAQVAPPLPFIGDDILQTFDDDRALAAMRVLQQVSLQVQVILLTHHRHVLDLAAQLPPGTVHVCRIGATHRPSREDCETLSLQLQLT